MDIWAWVHKLYTELEEAGQGRTAELLFQIPNLICDRNASEAEALMPEALAAAKALNNPWVEIFFRHWNMRLRLGEYGEGEVALAEAVSLLEFAYRKGNEECPQSVCAVQDIAACYGKVDGVGWAPERRAVCEETIARITPEWPCFSCLSEQYIVALEDEGRFQEAFTYMEKSYAAMKQAGKSFERGDYHTQYRLLYRLGKTEQALAELLELEGKEFAGDNLRVMNEGSFLKALFLAELGRAEEAWDVLLPWKDAAPARYPMWSHIVYLLALLNNEQNTWGLGGSLKRCLDHAHRVQAHRHVMEVGERHVRLALMRGAVGCARRALAIMEEHLPKLRAPFEATTRIAALKKELEALPSPTLPVPVAGLLEYLDQQETRNPEKELDMLYAALSQEPDNVDLLLTTQNALQACSETEEAKKLLQGAIYRTPALARKCLSELMPLLDEEGDAGELAAMAAFLAKHDVAMAHWCNAHLAYRAEQWEDVDIHITKLLHDMPEAIGARRFAAYAAVKDKNFARAIILYQEVIQLLTEKGEEYRGDQWDLLTAASANQQWALVRSTALTMGFPVEEGDTPIEDEGEQVEVCFYENGEWHSYAAQRTGPVTARILAVAPPSGSQHAKDWVVFNPEPMEPAPEDEEAAKNFVHSFKVVHVLEKGDVVSWILDGAAPGEEAWSAFQSAVKEQGWMLWTYGWGDYRVLDPNAPASAEEGETAGEDDSEEESGLLGVYAAIGTPSATSPVAVNTFLAKATATWEHPVSWRDLAHAAGCDVAQHEAIVVRYGL